MPDNFQKLIRSLGASEISLNEPLAGYTYFKIGGPADLFFLAADLRSLEKAVSLAHKHQVPYFILGGGSNVLISDKGFRGLVIKNRADKLSFHKYTGKIQNQRLEVQSARVTAESGVLTNQLVRQSIQENLSGLEYFLGLPGTVGGAIYNNAHFQTEMIGNFIESIVVLDKHSRQKRYLKQDLHFRYDYSILQETKELLLSATFRLKGGSAAELWKKAEFFAGKRSETQPLEMPSSGCIFKNLTKPVKAAGQNQPTQSAGCLIDTAGLKGVAVGGAEVSRKHANFIINKGGATAADVLALAYIIQKKVTLLYGVNLEMEIFKLGEF